MKRHNDSLYWQNMQLYAWGVLVNGLGLSLADARGGFRVCSHLRTLPLLGRQQQRCRTSQCDCT